jgi:hypothetical protein
MNDMAFRCEHAIADAGSLARTDLAELNRSLRRNINSARGYCLPIELADVREAEPHRALNPLATLFCQARFCAERISMSLLSMTTGVTRAGSWFVR